jgi:serine/threonine protein kinase
VSHRWECCLLLPSAFRCLTWSFLFHRQILEGINHIHAQGIIHRDLKPANVFITSENKIKVCSLSVVVVVFHRCLSILYPIPTLPPPVIVLLRNLLTDSQIGDFGLATASEGPADPAAVALRESALTSAGSNSGLTTGVGTPFYVSPEQLKTGKYELLALALSLLSPLSFALGHSSLALSFLPLALGLS